MKVLIPSPLVTYTQSREVQANGATLEAVLGDLERQFPGIRFRMVDEQSRLRPHVRFFTNGRQVFDLQHALQPGDELAIVQALSGG